MEGYAIARQNGWMSADDIRGLENLNPIGAAKGGDEYLVNGNMIPIKQAGQQNAAAQTGEQDDQTVNEGNGDEGT